MNKPSTKIKEVGISWPLLISICLICSWQPAFASEKPKRIVSMNQCTDQFLLALADRNQILALSPFAHDKETSFFADKAIGLPRIREGSESVIKLKPDILLATGFDRANTLAIIRRQGIKVVVLQYPTNLEQIAIQFDTVGKAIGQIERGNALSKKFTNLLKTSRKIFTDSGLSALYYQRGGYASGKHTLMGLLLEHSGLINHAARNGIAAYGNLSLEHIVADPPDIFMIARYNKTAEDQGHQLLTHPALAWAMAKGKVLRFPISETVCPGPGTISVLNRLIKLYKDNRIHNNAER